MFADLMISRFLRFSIYRLKVVAVVMLIWLPCSAGGPSSIVVSVSPNSTMLMINSTQQFTATVTGTTKTAVTWSCSGGSINSTGMYTAPSTAGIYNVQATLVSDSSKVGTASVTVVAPGITNVVVSPSARTLATGESCPITGYVYGYGDTSGDWTLSGGSGTISNEGSVFGLGYSNLSYQAPQSPGTYALSYTSRMDPTKSATAIITVVIPGVSVSPANVTLQSYGTQQFTASVVGLSNTAVTWSCSGGSVSNSGLFTAPYLAGTYSITAISVQNSTITGLATATVPLRLAIDRSTVSLSPNSSCSLGLTTNASSTPSVTWTCSGGSVTPSTNGSVIYKAPAISGIYTVTVTSNVDSTVTASVSVRVAPPVIVKVTPGAVSLALGTTQQFSTSVTGGLGNPTVTWTCSGGTISSSGMYTAPQNAGSYSVWATSVDDPSITTTAKIIVPPQISISPTSLTMLAGAGQVFTATVLGINQSTVTWSASGGVVDQGGRYTAPNAVGTYTVTAKQDDWKVSASATVTTTQGPISVSLNPTGTAIPVGGTQQFQAHLIGTANTGVTWSASTGSISASGYYTAPANTGTATITATSVADPTKSATTTLTIMAAIPLTSISIAPITVNLTTSESQSFTGKVTNNSNTKIYWEPLGGGNYYGALSATGVYTAPAVLQSSNNSSYFSLIKAHPQADYSKSSVATVTLQTAGPINVTITPPAKTEFVEGEMATFAATVSGTADTRVKWSLDPYANFGSTISVLGAFQAGGLISSANYVDVALQAASMANPSRVSFLTVRVWKRGAVLISPGSFTNPPLWQSQSVSPGSQVQFAAEVKGGGGVIWTCSDGTITNTGLFTAPSGTFPGGGVYVTATNAIDPSQSTTVGFNVPGLGDVSISPTGVTLGVGSKQSFTATVQGGGGNSVTWDCRMADGSSLNPGTISRGTYTAPAYLDYGEGERKVIVRATSGSSYAEANVTVQGPLSAGVLDAVSSCWSGCTLIATYDASGSAGGGWGTDPYKFWSISGNGTILAAWYDWSHGYPVVKYTATAPGTVTITAHPSNTVSSLTINATTQILAIPDFSGEFVSSTGTLSERILDFGIKNVNTSMGTTRSIRRIWTGDTLGMDSTTLSGQSCVATRFGISGSTPVWGYTYTANFSLDGNSITGYQSGTKSGNIVVGVETAGTVAAAELNHTMWSTAFTTVGGTVQFQAAVGGAADKAVTWTCSAGSITQDGLYTAPATPGTYTVTATSNASITGNSYTVKVGVTASSTLHVAGIYKGPVVYAYDGVARASTLSLFEDNGTIYGKLNGAQVTGAMTGRVFQGWYRQQVNYGGMLSQPIEMVFDPQPDGSFVLNGTYSYFGWFGSGYYQTSAYTYGVATNQVPQPNIVDLRIVPKTDFSPIKLLGSGTATFKALVVGNANTDVTWSANGGTIQANGNSVTFTAPAVSSKGTTFILTATSVADPTKSESVTISVDPAQPTVLPAQASIYASSVGYSGSIASFAATFPSQLSNEAFWSILETTPGAPTVDAWGVVHPGWALGTFTVVATSQWNSTVNATASVTVNEARPSIGYFYSDFTSVQPGDTVTVTWDNISAYNTPNPQLLLTIADSIGSQVIDVTGKTSYSVTLTRTTTFTLMARSVSGLEGNRSLTVTVASSAVISALVANPGVIRAGDPVTLVGTFTAASATLYYYNRPTYSWLAYGPITSGTPVTIQASHPSVLHVQPQFYLQASDANGNTIQSYPITIPCTPAILQFVASPTGILTGSGASSTLSWGIDSAGLAGTVTLKATTQSGVQTSVNTGGATSWTVTPTETTTYNLMVTSTAGGDSRLATVRVGDVASVTITPASVTLAPGASKAFTASVLAVQGKDGLTWSYSGGSLSGGGTSATWVAPQTEGTYTVTATSTVDPTVFATATVIVSKSVGTLPPPTLDVLSFSSGPSPQGPGHVLLSWSTVGATTITLQDSNGLQLDATGQTSYDVTPVGTTIYTLTITDGKSYISRTLTIPGAGYAVAVVPTQVTMFTGVSYKFGYSIYAPSNQVTWTCDGGTIAVDGTFTAPTTAGIYTVTAALVDDPTKTSSATVTVNDVSLMITPSYLTLTTGQSFSFGYQAFTYSDDRLTWSASAGSITSDGVFTAPLTTGTVTITLTSSKDTTKTATATVEVKPIDLMILPSVLWVLPQGQYQLAAGTSLGSVNWSVVEANGGSIDANGIYTAPNEVGTFTIKATSAQDSTRFATATAIVATSGGGNWGPGSGGGGTFSPQNYGVSVEPAMSTVDAGTYQALRATVLGNEDQSVTWEVAGGTVQAAVDDQGVFTAHEPGIYTVVATSKVNSALQGSALLVVESSVKGLRNVPAELDLEGYSVTVLKDGKVLLVGGQDTRVIDTDPVKGYRETAYLFDPGTKTFTATGSLIQARAGHMATLLSDGRVLIAGGMGYFKWPTDPNAIVQEQPVKWGEIYNPATGQFEALPPPPDHPLYPAGSMRSAHGSTGQASTLFNGQVLMVGGPSGVQTYWPFDIFDPTTNLFDLTDIVTGNIANQEIFQTREGGAVVALDDGRALLTGGGRTYSVNESYPCGISSCVLNEARMFDPQSPSALVPVTGMTQARTGHTMTKLPNGKILIIGGSDHFTLASTSTFLPNPTATAEIYDPATGTFTPTDTMKWARSGHAAILLPNGQVMVVGGYLSATWDGTGTIWSYPTETELYDPETGTFSVMDKLAFGLDRPKLALMQTGEVFLSGKPIVTATAGTPAAALMAAGKKSVRSVIAPQTLTGSSGLQEAIFGRASIDPNLQIVAAYPEVFSKVKTSAGRHILCDQDYGLRWSYTTTAPPYSSGELVNAISIPKGNSLALVPRDGKYIPSADAEDYTSTNHHGRYYILKVRRRKGTWFNLNLKIDITVGGVVRTISPFPQGYSLLEEVLGPTDPIVDVDTHPHDHKAGDTYYSVGGPTQPYIQQIRRYDILQYSIPLQQNVPTGLEFVYYKIPVTFHTANPSPVSWDETVGGEPPGDLCTYSFNLTGVYVPTGGTISQSSISKADCRPPNVKVSQVALWPLPRAAWDAFGRAGTRICMGGDYWVSLDSFHLLQAQALADPGSRWPWLQALVDAPGVPDGLLNDITYEHGGGHNGEHFSGNDIDMPPPKSAFNDADSRGKFFYDLLISPAVHHFYYYSTNSSRDLFFKNTNNISAYWQTEINNIPGDWRDKWQTSPDHESHIHVSLRTSHPHGL